LTSHYYIIAFINPLTVGAFFNQVLLFASRLK